MSEQDTPMDALDQRLTAYLQGRAEMAAAFGPGPDHVAATISAGAGWVALPGQRGRFGVRAIPTLAWALLAIAVLAVMALAIAAGSDRDDGLVVLPPASAEPPDASPGQPAPIVGTWWLDFAASAIDDRYAGTRSELFDRFLSGVEFAPDGRFQVSSGMIAGCTVRGTWERDGDVLAVDLPTEADPCEDDGPGPAAREIRQRLVRADHFDLQGTRLTLLDAVGNSLLVFDRSTDGRFWRPLRAAYEGRWRLDFDASGIEGSYTLTSLPRRPKVEVASAIDLADGVVSGGTGAGGGCDSFEGTYSDVGGRLTISVPATEGHCGRGPVYPDLEVRTRLVRTALWQVDGDVLRLLDADGTLLLLYRRFETDTP